MDKLNTIRLIREGTESNNKFFKRYEKKLKELDYTSVTYTNDYAEISFYK